MRLEPSPTQQSPAPPLYGTALEPLHAAIAGATPLAPSKQADGIGSTCSPATPLASSHCPPAPPQCPPTPQQESPFQTPRASSTNKPIFSPGAASDNIEMLPGSCAMSEVMPGSSAAMSDIGGSAAMSVDGGAMSEDGDGAAQFPAAPEFPWKQDTSLLPHLQPLRSRFQDMLVGGGVLVLHRNSSHIEVPGRSDSADPSPSPVATPVCARTARPSQESGVSVFYAATIGSKCIHVGNTLHLEKFSFKCWLCWSPVSLLKQFLWGCQRLLLSCVLRR